jgi:uncharacterized protein YndB with AHSA1/START domain
MSTLKRLRFAERIRAPVELVWQRMLSPDSYRAWTAAFCEGSHFEGSWDQGSTIRFLGPSGDGMLSTIAENRPCEFISIQHLGQVVGGVEKRGEAAAGWAGAFENYTFRRLGDGTEVIVEQDVLEDHAPFMREVWPRALQKLKALCESSGAGSGA